MPAKLAGSPALPASRAFLVHFSRDSGFDVDSLSGRVEHLNSGRRAQFDSGHDLLAALTLLLDTIDEPERHE